MDDFEKKIRVELIGLDKKQLCQFAWLCGVRSLPFLSTKKGFVYWYEKARQKHLYSIFNALDVAITIDKYDVSAVRAASDAKDAISIFIKDDNVAYYAIKAASASIYAAGSARAYSYASSYAARAADAYYATEIANKLFEDIEAIRENRLDKCKHDINVYGKLWYYFINDLKAIGCNYWAKIYEDLFNNGFHTIDEKELERRLVRVPDEIKSEGAAAVGRYLERLGDNVERLNEARIIILGEKGAGKTSLARRLLDIDAQMPKEEESTEGVITNIWSFEGKDGINVNAHVWDFAGHSITHSAHRCFMSARCLYIYVYNGRIERNNDPTYWLEQIRIHGGDSPILFLINEKDGHKADIAERTLRKDYPSIVNYYPVDIGNEDKTKLEEFRQTVMNTVCDNPSWNKQVVSEEAYKIKNELRKRFDKEKEPHITREQFDKIAENCGAPKECIKQILKDLHTLGICLWYDKEDMEDFSMLVLNPDWITNGIYKIINEGFRKDEHILSVDKGTEILKNDERYKYSDNNVRYLFKLMRLYELAFFKDTDNIFIPGILPIDRPNSDKIPTFDDAKDRLTMEFKVEKVLPPNIVARIIVQRHEDIYDENLLWCRGAVLKDATALIEEDGRSVTVKVKGEGKTEYIKELRDMIKGIFGEYNVKLELSYELIESENPEDAEQPNSQEIKPSMLTEDKIIRFLQINRKYFDIFSERDIYLARTASEYSIDIPSIKKNILEKRIHDNETKKQKLKEIYQKGGLTLVLGAGVSMDSENMPSWKKLIEALLSDMTKKIEKELPFDNVIADIEKLAENKEDSPLTQVRRIRNAYSFNNNVYNRIIHKIFYYDEHDKKKKEFKIDTKLLKAITTLCRQKITRVITYNFDNILEIALEKSEKLEENKLKWKSVYKDSYTFDAETLNIYHVHGYLPDDLNKVDDDTNIVFSEEDYHKAYSDVYNWSNMIQLNCFSESTCLFIGCSLNDPNARRLLDAAQRNVEGTRHYAILLKEEKACNDTDALICEEDYRSLGINVIWVNNHNETPKILAELIGNPANP